MRGVSLCIALAALVMHQPATAGDRLSYNQFDVGLGLGLLNSGDTYGGIGLNVAASMELTSFLYAFGSFNTMRFSEWHMDDDDFGEGLAGFLCPESCESDDHAPEDDSRHVYKRASEFGLGLNFPLNPQHDVLLGVSRMDQRVERDGHLGDDSPRGPREVFRGKGPNLRLGLRAAYFNQRVNASVAANYGWLDTDITRTGPFGNSIPSYRNKTLGVFGVTAGLNVKGSGALSFDYKLSAVRFAGDTEMRVQLGVRLQFQDWDGPP
jgi:hypothetical protein